jgi:[protein-PII] uridylyltransferase
MIMDQFDLVPATEAEAAGGGSDEFWRSTAETIREVLSAEEKLGGRSRLSVLLEGALRHPGGFLPEAAAEARVSFDNRVSAGHTVVDVECPDRPGLLYALSAGISDAGADIAFAKINTVDKVAHDVFYITVNGAKAEDRETHRRIRAAMAAELRRLSG